MVKDSNELLDYVLRELQVAMSNNKEEAEVKIVLSEYFKGEKKEIAEFAKKLHINTITQTLREKFSDYTVRSIVGPEPTFSAIITCKTGPCYILCRLVWTLTLQKKAL